MTTFFHILGFFLLATSIVFIASVLLGVPIAAKYTPEYAYECFAVAFKIIMILTMLIYIGYHLFTGNPF